MHHTSWLLSDTSTTLTVASAVITFFSGLLAGLVSIFFAAVKSDTLRKVRHASLFELLIKRQHAGAEKGGSERTRS